MFSYIIALLGFMLVNLPYKTLPLKWLSNCIHINLDHMSKATHQSTSCCRKLFLYKLHLGSCARG